MKNHGSINRLKNSPTSLVVLKQKSDEIILHNIKPDNTIAFITATVICLHIAVLLLMINSSTLAIKETSLPTIIGVLIQKTPLKKKEATKYKPKPKLKSKKTPSKNKSSIQQTTPISPPMAKQNIVLSSVDEPVVIEEQHEPAPITTPRSDASYLKNTAPVYPRASLRRHEEGKVILELLVRSSGIVGEARVKESSGYTRLDNAALKAIRHWKYVPARQNGKAINFWYQQPFIFSLRK